MKAYFSRQRYMQLSALVLSGLLCSSIASAEGGEQTAPDFTAPLLGTEGDQAYIDAHVRQADGTYRFTKDSLIFYQNEKDEELGAIRLLADLKIDAANHILTVKTNTTMGNQGKAAVHRAMSRPWPIAAAA